jgi:glycerophosphoryl diester phosphodiesterase
MSKINVISHRGANKYAPQNTIPAFKKSLEIGVDGFETDVHMTRDGYPVICHNYTVNEMSNGMGRVSAMTLDEFRRLDFGSYFSPEFKGTKGPTLDEFLSVCENADIEIMNIELKPPLNGEVGIVYKTIEKVKEHGLFDKLLISSFDYKLLVECKHVDEKCRTGYLYSPDKTDSLKMWYRPVDFAKEIKADYLHPFSYYVTKFYVDAAHKAGIGVNPWTVDNTLEIKRMIFDGVDGIITNVPDKVKKIIAETK